MKHRVYLTVITAVLLTAFSLAPRAVGAQSGWTTKASMLIARTAGVALTGQDGRIYVFGGTDGTRNFANAEVYTPNTDTWTPIAPLPVAESYMAGAVAPNGKMYLIGGWDGQASTNSAFAYDPATNSYACSVSHTGCASSSLPPLPTPRSNLAVTLGTDGLIYAIGGFTSQPVATVEAFDPVANVWHKVTPLPQPSAGLTAMTDSDGTIYVSGGFDGQNYLSTVYGGKRASGSRTLARIAPLTSALAGGTVAIDWQIDFKKIQSRKDAEAVWLGLYLFLALHHPDYPYDIGARPERHQPASEAQANISGYVYIVLGGSSGGPATNAVSIYDPANNTVIQGQPMPTARESEMAAVGADNTIYVMGGDGGSGSNPFSSMDAWVPPPAPTATSTSTPAPLPTSTATATPVPAKLTATPKRPVSKPCPKHAKRKHAKCACQKGYKLVHGKCKKAKKHL